MTNTRPAARRTYRLPDGGVGALDEPGHSLLQVQLVVVVVGAGAARGAGVRCIFAARVLVLAEGPDEQEDDADELEEMEVATGAGGAIGAAGALHTSART